MSCNSFYLIVCLQVLLVLVFFCSLRGSRLARLVRVQYLPYCYLTEEEEAYVWHVSESVFNRSLWATITANCVFCFVFTLILYPKYSTQVVFSVGFLILEGVMFILCVTFCFIENKRDEHLQCLITHYSDLAMLVPLRARELKTLYLLRDSRVLLNYCSFLMLLLTPIELYLALK